MLLMHAASINVISTTNYSCVLVKRHGRISFHILSSMGPSLSDMKKMDVAKQGVLYTNNCEGKYSALSVNGFPQMLCTEACLKHFKTELF